MMNLRSLILAVAVLLSACDPAPVASGTWRATLDLPGGELPFSLEMQQTGDTWSATLINGVEKVRVPIVMINNSDLRMLFPAFNTRIDATRDGTGFSGTLTLIKRGGIEQVMPFHASPGTSHRFFAQPAAKYKTVAGRWEVVFTEDDGASSQAVAEFTQDKNRVKGTFLTPTGDYRFLDGEVVGDTLHLSTFDGSHAFLFKADEVDGELHGDFWSGTAWHESWVARRNEDAALPDAYSLTRFVGDEFSFEFPDTTGKMVSFDDPRFAGKVVLIAMAGSWCPNCHDEAEFLAPFYKKYRDQGLEVVGLMFEHLDQFEDAAKQVRAFRDKFDIEYTLLIAGSSDKKRAAQTMTMLDRVYAYPTSIFVDRNGKVRHIHTGFTGPGTGQHYQALTADFARTVEQLLSE